MHIYAYTSVAALMPSSPTPKLTLTVTVTLTLTLTHIPVWHMAALMLRRLTLALTLILTRIPVWQRWCRAG